MVWDGPGDMELVRQGHEEELEPALHHLLVVAGLTGVKQLPAMGGGVQVSVEVLGGGVKVSLDRDVVVFCLKALLTASITCILLWPLSLGFSSSLSSSLFGLLWVLTIFEPTNDLRIVLILCWVFFPNFR